MHIWKNIHSWSKVCQDKEDDECQSQREAKYSHMLNERLNNLFLFHLIVELLLMLKNSCTIYNFTCEKFG